MDTLQQVQQLRDRIKELEADVESYKKYKCKVKVELLNVMKFLSDTDKTELEISYYEKLASDWMNNWIKE